MLAANTVLKELDLSDNLGPGARDGAGFAQELAVGIRDNGALSKLITGGNRYGWIPPFYQTRDHVFSTHLACAVQG